MNHDRIKSNRRSPRATRFEWSAWLAAAFVLLVVAPALQANPVHSAQNLAPLYAALLPSQHHAPETVRSFEAALAVLESVPQKSTAHEISAPSLQHLDGSSVKSTVEIDRTFWRVPQPLAGPRVHLAHVVLFSALTAHEASYRSGTRNNRSHE
ncbi:MAG TPA: hypothetical protein VF681_05995 [Abditibacteriaceae bacterium]|jgi:hypothetical protein